MCHPARWHQQGRLTAAAQSPEPDPLACFCLLDPDEAYFLWGCQDATPNDDVTKQAICWNRQTQSLSEAPVRHCQRKILNT